MRAEKPRARGERVLSARAADECSDDRLLHRTSADPGGSVSGAAAPGRALTLTGAIGVPAVTAVVVTLVLLAASHLGLARVALVGAAGACLVALCILPYRFLPSAMLVAGALVPVAYVAITPYDRFSGPATVVILVWLVRSIGRPRSTRAPTVLSVAFGSALVVLLFYSVVTIDLPGSVAWASTAVVMVGGVAYAATRTDHSALGPLVRTWLVLGCLLGVFAVIEFVTHANPLSTFYASNPYPIVQEWSVYRVTTTLGHPLMNGLFFAVTAVVACRFVVRRDEVVPLPLAAACAFLSTTGAVLSASRGAILGLAAGCSVIVLATLMGARMSLSRKLTYGAVLGVGALGAWLSPVIQARSGAREAASSSEYRTVVLNAALHELDVGHYLGSGAGTSQLRLAYAGIDLTLENSWAQLALSLGVPGVVAVIGLFLAIMMTGARRRALEVVSGTATFIIVMGTFNVIESNVQSLFVMSGLVAVVLIPRPSSRPSHSWSSVTTSRPMATR